MGFSERILNGTAPGKEEDIKSEDRTPRRKKRGDWSIEAGVPQTLELPEDTKSGNNPPEVEAHCYIHNPENQIGGRPCDRTTPCPAQNPCRGCGWE